MLAVVLLLIGPAGVGAQEVPVGWTVREDLRIGSRDAPEQILTRVSHVRIGPEGGLYVGQPMDRTILVLDAGGREVRRIGRRGQGPGEFEALGGFGFLGDTLYATDVRLNRISLFGPAGGILKTFVLRSPMIDDHSPPWYLPAAPSWFQSDGTALVLPLPPPLVLSAGIVGEAPLLRLDRAGVLLDTMVWADVSVRSIEITSGGQKYYASPPFAAPRLVVVMADGAGLVAIDRKPVERGRATFRVTRIGVSADTLFSREYEYAPVGVSDAAVDAAVEQITATLSRRGPPPRPAEIERALRSGDRIPAHLPPVTAAASGADGSIWVRREETLGQTARWDVLDRNGELQATLELPRRVTVETVSGDVMVGVELDELDVPYVVRYRIMKR
jgi:hypothetical protein